MNNGKKSILCNTDNIVQKGTVAIMTVRKELGGHRMREIKCVEMDWREIVCEETNVEKK